MTTRRVLTVLLALFIAIIVFLLGSAIAQGDRIEVVLSVIGLLVFGALAYAHWRDWPWTPHAAVVATTVLAILGNPPEITRQGVSFTVLLPGVIAAMLLPWYWSVGAYMVCLAGIAAQTGGQGPLFEPENLALASTIAVGISLAGTVARHAQYVAEANAGRAEQALAEVRHAAGELEEANRLMNIQLDQQQQLLDLVASLETPVVPLADGVLFAPVVGHVDTRRSRELMSRLLDAAHEQRTRLVIVDIAGVAMMDTAVARALMQTASALRLLGCRVTISGISAAVASTMTYLGISMEGIETARNPQEALGRALERPTGPAPATANGAGRGS